VAVLVADDRAERGLLRAAKYPGSSDFPALARADYQFEVKCGERVEQLLDGLGGFTGFELGDRESVGSRPLAKFALGQSLRLARSAQCTPQPGR
jgi:hypothetical protein